MDGDKCMILLLSQLNSSLQEMNAAYDKITNLRIPPLALVINLTNIY